VGLSESNGSLSPGFMTHVTGRQTAKNWDQLWNHTLGNRVWATFTFVLKQQQQPVQRTLQSTFSVTTLLLVLVLAAAASTSLAASVSAAAAPTPSSLIFDVLARDRPAPLATGRTVMFTGPEVGPTTNHIFIITIIFIMWSYDKPGTRDPIHKIPYNLS